MPNDLIRYDLLVQDALCGVVKKVLGDVARHGLPGDHHFYITFRTHAAGVRLSSRMREQYPEEMTIILQHQFDDLRVNDHAFEVGLSFKGIPEMLLIPFDALTGFFDPSVQFSAKFEPQPDVDGEEGPTVTHLPGPRAVPSRPAGLAAVPPSAVSSVPTLGLPKPDAPQTSEAPVKPAKADGVAKAAKQDAVKPEIRLAPDAEPETNATEGTKVVSIDAFRKKP